jgi:multiple sugar transport system substrate-binding protein
MSAEERVLLAGIGWDHDRCMAPLRASVAIYSAIDPGVRITWATRSLKEFGDGNLEALSRDFDLLIFDHPYVGAASLGGWLVDWAQVLPPARLEALRRDSLGPCLDSYASAGGLWGLPIDAAAQVAAVRLDLLDRVVQRVPQTGGEVVQLAAELRAKGLWMALPSVPIDAVCTFLTLCANLGEAVPRTPDSFPSMSTVHQALELQAELLSLSHPSSLVWNPIACYEHMSIHDDVPYVPFAFGYTNYSRASSRAKLQFANIPAFGQCGVAGSILGGAGLAISSRCKHISAAARYGSFLASSEFQSTEYTRSGGQPASLTAWRSPACDVQTGGYLHGTLETMTRSYLRPTFAGFVPYFKEAGERIHEYLAMRQPLRATAEWLELRFLALASS